MPPGWLCDYNCLTFDRGHGKRTAMIVSSDSSTPAATAGGSFPWELAAESITVRIRWFGLVVGYVLVNFVGERPVENTAVLNAILTLGAVYAVLDSLWSYHGKVFLSDVPIVVSLMEAVFIGLLCYFDTGIDSPFRFYYFLSLLVCAIRYWPWVTYATFGLHSASFSLLLIQVGGFDRGDLGSWLLNLIVMGWATWAGTALAELLKRASRRLSELNTELQENQTLLEHRIAERTGELQQSQALLVQQEKRAAFGLLAAGIAHEVGNPLAAISSLVQLLKRRPLDDYTRERLQMVDDQLTRIQRTLRELVNFSRPATTELSLCDVNAVIEDALSIAKYYKRKKGKRIVTNYASGLPKLRCVRDGLVQVFLNLILNAMDATRDGGLIEITSRLEAGWIRVTIRDDGRGIAEVHRRTIFEPYFTTKPTGTGLGLFVCRHILSGMDEGRIDLLDTSPEGTTFEVAVTCDNVRRCPDSLEETSVVFTEEVPAT